MPKQRNTKEENEAIKAGKRPEGWSSSPPRMPEGLPVALRAPSETAPEEEPDDPFIEDFSNEVMCMSYLYSKLPETGVSSLIGTGGGQQKVLIERVSLDRDLYPFPAPCDDREN